MGWGVTTEHLSEQNSRVTWGEQGRGAGVWLGMRKPQSAASVFVKTVQSLGNKADELQGNARFLCDMCRCFSIKPLHRVWCEQGFMHFCIWCSAGVTDQMEGAALVTLSLFYFPNVEPFSISPVPYLKSLKHCSLKHCLPPVCHSSNKTK